MKKNLLAIFKNIKSNFLSKDKNVIIKTIGDIIAILFVAIIIKIPFLFLKTLLLDFLNSNELAYSIQNAISILFELGYIFLAITYIYIRLKKRFVKDNEGI